MLLELTAICGEFPADLLSHLPGSDSYKMTIIWALKRDKLLKTQGLPAGNKSQSCSFGSQSKAFFILPYWKRGYEHA